jgi:urease accessory protein
VEHGRVFDRWRLRRGGRLIHAEGVRLGGSMSEKLSAAAIANGGVAIATLLFVPGDGAVVAAMCAIGNRLRGEVGGSSWNGLSIVRFCASDGAALRHDLMQVLAVLKVPSLPRLWVS